ncbi:MAG: TonB-dependent receptor [Deltaproteobacteria bacterium]|nr:TonB-dependent receptor [Deltaproteobacteria bacterium]
MKRPWNGSLALPGIFFVLFLFPASLTVCRASDMEEHSKDLMTLSIEELMDIEVTSVSKKLQKLLEAPAAVFVVTQEDIRRSGASNIPDALRMVPGLQVARIDANKWAITSRGFNGRFANKLLVMIDGRSVYTPLFSGVFWDQQDTLIEDIERIEVIRGPGATMWGANAVNGVINIITKGAKDTQGVLLSTGAGSEERGFLNLRYGNKIGDASYRVYLKYFDRDTSVAPGGGEAADAWNVLRAGFRADMEMKESDSLTLQGDFYNGEAGITTTAATLTSPFQSTSSDDTYIAGGNLLARWRRAFSSTSDMALQFYYDRTEFKFEDIEENRDTFDLDFQHRFALGGLHEILLGLGYRLTRDDIKSSFYLSLDPESRQDNLLSAFVQDEIELLKEKLVLTVGSKFEHNNYTGVEIQPSARLLWTPDPDHSVWTAVSRAVRTPSRAEDDIRINSRVVPPGVFDPALPAILAVLGDRNYESEELIAFELGYRLRPLERLSLDLATFYNLYDNMRTLELGSASLETTPSPAHIVVPFTAANMMDGETYGVEVSADWQALDWWSVHLAYTYMEINLRLEGGSTDTTSEENVEGQSPHSQISLRSFMDLGKGLELDIWARYVDDLPDLNIESYTTLDARLSWKPRKDLEISVIGQNLLDKSHREFAPELINILATEVERSVYGKLTWRF